MSMRNRAAAFVTAGLVAGSAALAGDRPDLGRPATEAEIAAWDIAVGPDGAELPPGSGTPEQGRVVYETSCLACHGEEGVGGLQDRLVGGLGSLDTDKPVKTIGSFWPYATTVFDYIRRAMPLMAPMSLTDDEVYAVTAYLLHLNGIIAADAVMNAETLPEVEMPNRDGFVVYYPDPRGPHR